MRNQENSRQVGAWREQWKSSSSQLFSVSINTSNRKDILS
nr:MAG TPA: hypothetical protein [Caudoviricetes sp.]